MPEQGVVEFVVRAREEASEALAHATGGVTDLTASLGRLAKSSGVFGLIAAGATTAAFSIVAAGKSIADAVQNLDRTAARTGVSIERLQAIQEVVKEGGGDVEAVTTALGFLNRAIATQDPLLKKLGISTRDTFTAFMQLATALSNSRDAAARTEIAFRLLGRGSGEILGTIDKVAGSVEAMQAALRESGGLITGKTAESGRALEKQLTELERSWKGLVVSFQTLAVPAASAVIGMLDNILKAVVGFGRAVRDDVVGPIEEAAAAARAAGLGAPQRTASNTADMFTLLKDAQGNFMIPDAASRFGITVSATRKEDPLVAALRKSETDAATRAREKRLEEIERLLVVGRTKAEEYLAALDKITDQKKGAEILSQLREAGVLPSGVGVLGEELKLRAPAPGKLAVGPPAQFDFAAYRKQVQQILDTAPKLSGAFVEVQTSWQNAVADMTSQASVLNDAFGSVYDGLQRGFQTAFAETGRQVRSILDGVRVIIGAIGQELEAMLARLLANKLFGILLSFLPGGAVAGAALGSGVSGALDIAATHSLSAGGPIRSAPLIGQLNVSAFDSRDLHEQFVSPGGSLRRAMEAAALSD